MNLLFSLFNFFTSFLFLHRILANDQFVTKHFATPAFHIDQSNRNVRFIRYIIKILNNFPINGPIFYGVGESRKTIEETRSKYGLFEKVAPNFLNAAIVYVEQRYFGNSTLLKEPYINGLEDFEQLTLGDTVSDNVLLIKKLAKRLKSFNFFIFGVEHGALISGYISNTFARNPDLRQFKVLTWTSSTPLKLMRQGLGLRSFSKFQSVSDRFKDLLSDSGCPDVDITRFGKFFKKVRSLTQNNSNTYNEILEKLNLDPIPKATLIHGDKTEPELIEFVIFLRNGIRDLAFKNKHFDEMGNKIKSSVLNKLCDAIKNVPSTDRLPIIVKPIEDILSLILPNYKPLGQGLKLTDKKVGQGLISLPSFWRINPIAGPKLNRLASLKAYQQCTNWQLTYCSNDFEINDPFAHSSYDDNLPCKDIEAFDYSLEHECKGLFNDSYDPTFYAFDQILYPINLEKNVVVTMNTESIYSLSYELFTGNETNPGKFIFHDKVKGPAGEEFNAPKNCDSNKTIDLRYLMLRSFACLANFIDEKTKIICDEDLLFYDGNYNNGLKSDNCVINDSIVFPYGHYNVNFIELEMPIENDKTGIENKDKSNDEINVDTPKNNANFLFQYKCLFMLFLSFEMF